MEALFDSACWGGGAKAKLKRLASSSVVITNNDLAVSLHQHCRDDDYRSGICQSKVTDSFLARPSFVKIGCWIIYSVGLLL